MRVKLVRWKPFQLLTCTMINRRDVIMEKEVKNMSYSIGGYHTFMFCSVAFEMQRKQKTKCICGKDSNKVHYLKPTNWSKNQNSRKWILPFSDDSWVQIFTKVCCRILKSKFGLLRSQFFIFSIVKTNILAKVYLMFKNHTLKKKKTKLLMIMSL